MLIVTREKGDGQDFLADVMCVALNHLPAKYYRHTIDMIFYLADGELETMKKNSLSAVQEAREFVRAHQRDD